MATTMDYADHLRKETSAAQTNGNHGVGNGIPNYSTGNGAPLQPIDTSVTIPRDVFEKLYLQPQMPIKGDLRKTFGNPTPLALVGFVVSAFPLGCDLMGWRGAGGNGAASIGVYLFMGGTLQLIGSILEFFLGNTFTFVVFGTIGGFWLSFGATLQPFYNAEGAYAPGDKAELTPAFASSYAFFLLAMAIVIFFFLICSLRTNIFLVVLFFALTLSFSLLSASYWQYAKLNVVVAQKLQVGGGACIFALSLIGFVLTLAQLLESVDFPFAFPVGDLSTVIQGRSQRVKAKRDRDHEA